MPSPALQGNRYRAFHAADSTGKAGESKQPSIKVWEAERGPAPRPAAARWRRSLPVATLGAIVLGALGLATVWVFLVPIDQAPDEPGHWDYALSLWEHGGIYKALGAKNEHH